jgi:hypothetical protein
MSERDREKAERYVRATFDVREGLSVEQIQTWLAHSYAAGLRAGRKEQSRRDP